jgi:hypothetical protein
MRVFNVRGMGLKHIKQQQHITQQDTLRTTIVLTIMMVMNQQNTN